MKYAGLIFLFTLFLSCHSGDKVKRYTISDLKFPEDNIRKARMRNNISQSYFYIDAYYVDGIYYNRMNNTCDSYVTMRYDTNGNMIRDIDGSYQYNNENMLVHSVAGRCLASSRDYTYLFHSNKRILYNVGDHDSVIYEFDEAGRIFKERSSDLSHNASISYQYNKRGNVIRSVFSLEMKHVPEDYDKNVIKSYFYSANKLDSIITERRLFNDSVYTERDYYDENELLVKSVQYLKHCPYCPFYREPIVTYSVRNIKRDSL